MASALNNSTFLSDGDGHASGLVGNGHGESAAGAAATEAGSGWTVYPDVTSTSPAWGSAAAGADDGGHSDGRGGAHGTSNEGTSADSAFGLDGDAGAGLQQAAPDASAATVPGVAAAAPAPAVAQKPIILRGTISAASAKDPPRTLLWSGLWAMQEAVGELEAPFEYRFTVPAAYSAGGLGNAAGVTPLLPSDEHAPVLSAPFAGYYLIKSLDKFNRAEEGDVKAIKSVAGSMLKAPPASSSKVCVIRIGGPVADTAPKAIAAPVGATPFPHSACVGISGGGYNGALRRRFTFHGAYHPPSGTAWAYKIYDAPPEGATAAPTSTVKTPKAPKPAAGGSGDGGFSKTLVRAGLDTSAILPTASRERRPAPPRVELASAVTPPQAEKAGAAAIAASLGPDMAAMAEILAALQADVFCADFLQPVDWERHGLPDYPTIVKKPMDLSTVETKLRNGAYASPAAFRADMELIASNAILYNGEASPVGASAKIFVTKFLKKFEGWEAKKLKVAEKAKADKLKADASGHRSSTGGKRQRDADEDDEDDEGDEGGKDGGAAAAAGAKKGRKGASAPAPAPAPASAPQMDAMALQAQLMQLTAAFNILAQNQLMQAQSAGFVASAAQLQQQLAATPDAAAVVAAASAAAAAVVGAGAKKPAAASRKSVGGGAGKAPGESRRRSGAGRGYEYIDDDVEVPDDEVEDDGGLLYTTGSTKRGTGGARRSSVGGGGGGPRKSVGASRAAGGGGPASHPLSRPAAVVPVQVPLTYAEKQALSSDVELLTGPQVDEVLKIISERTPLGTTDGEVELDVDSLDTRTQRELQSFVAQCLGRQPPVPAQPAAPAATPAGDRNAALVAQAARVAAENAGRLGALGAPVAAAAAPLPSTSMASTATLASAVTEEDAPPPPPDF